MIKEMKKHFLTLHVEFPKVEFKSKMNFEKFKNGFMQKTKYTIFKSYKLKISCH